MQAMWYVLNFMPHSTPSYLTLFLPHSTNSHPRFIFGSEIFTISLIAFNVVNTL